MHEFIRSTALAAPIERVYAFHADPENIHAISPPGQTAVVLEGGGPAGEGKTFAISVTLLGFIPLRWQGQWSIVDPPVLLCDIASSALFPHWEHRHEFRALPSGGTEMTDRLRYRLAFGPFGRLLGSTVVRVIFGRVFALRHRLTRTYFSS